MSKDLRITSLASALVVPDTAGLAGESSTQEGEGARHSDRSV